MKRLTDDPIAALAARRRFLRGAGVGMAAAAGLSPLGRLLAAAGTPAAASDAVGYGPLRLVRDLTTDLPLLRLPAGFSYRSFGWAGEPLSDGTPCPGNHDGMGIVRADGDRIVLVRNHEISRFDGAFGPPAAQYNPQASGGTVTLEFDAAQGKLVSARPSLSGTMNNCSGGTTPWGSWLSCEEFVADAGASGRNDGRPFTLTHDHGFTFEVPADGVSDARPLRDMGQMRHEAAVVHQPTGDVYLTEDTEPVAGFYRFVPKTRGRLADGGRLQMLRAVDAADLRSGLRVGQRFRVEWVDIDEPDNGYDAQNRTITGVQQQGRANGASAFSRLEGCICNDSEVFFTSTNGGDAGCGQVFAYYPALQELRLIYESPDAAVLDYPDNIVQSPRGGLVICQDSAQSRTQRLFGLTADAQLFRFAEQNVVLDGAKGFSGDFRRAEWAGACFSPDGRWLFANVYSPGFTVAITGPWRDGLV